MCSSDLSKCSNKYIKLFKKNNGPAKELLPTILHRRVPWPSSPVPGEPPPARPSHPWTGRPYPRGDRVPGGVGGWGWRALILAPGRERPAGRADGSPPAGAPSPRQPSRSQAAAARRMRAEAGAREIGRAHV